MPRVAYWRAQGWNVLVPDHRGSTGHGRAYQQALRGRWGELDISDIVDVLAHAHAHGWGSRRAHGDRRLVGRRIHSTRRRRVESAPARRGDRCLPRHGSLGSSPDGSDRFESHYTDSLVGELPATASRAAQPVTAPLRRAAQWYPDPAAARRHRPGRPDRPEPGVRRAMSRCRRRHRIRASTKARATAFGSPENQLDEYRRMHDFLASRVLGG